MTDVISAGIRRGVGLPAARGQGGRGSRGEGSSAREGTRPPGEVTLLSGFCVFSSDCPK